MSHVALRLVRASLPAIAIALVAAGAHAQDGTKAASVLAYDEAERLMAEGKLADACLKYAESERLDPQLGTLLHLADCFERNGQTASAWASFREAAELAEKRDDPRRETAEQRIANLMPRLSKLQIEVAAGTDQTTLQIKRDNVVVGSALWGAPVPTDPGPHTITASAPGLRSWTGNAIVKADGSTTIVQVPALESEVPKSPETSATPTTQTPTTRADARPETTPQTDQPSSSGPRRWPALVAGGVGLVGIGVGTAFGLISKGKGEDADAFCDGTACTDQRGVTLKDEAITAGNVSTVAFIVGGVGLAAGAILWFTAPSESPTTASRLRVGVGPTSLAVRTVW
jgi:hypothetical protein